MRTRDVIPPILIALHLLSASAAHANEDPVAIFSYADTSCGRWVASEGNEAARAQYWSWFRGFVSGYNFANPTSQVSLDRMPDKQTLFLFVDKYCRDNPLKEFVTAAFQLVEELRPKVAPAAKPKMSGGLPPNTSLERTRER